MGEFDQKKFNIYLVRVLQELLERAPPYDKPLADDFAVLCELIWTYDEEYQSLHRKARSENE